MLLLFSRFARNVVRISSKPVAGLAEQLLLSEIITIVVVRLSSAPLRKNVISPINHISLTCFLVLISKITTSNRYAHRSPRRSSSRRSGKTPTTFVLPRRMSRCL